MFFWGEGRGWCLRFWYGFDGRVTGVLGFWGEVWGEWCTPGWIVGEEEGDERIRRGYETEDEDTEDERAVDEATCDEETAKESHEDGNTGAEEPEHEATRDEDTVQEF